MNRHKASIPDRGLRIAEQIQRDLAEIIQRELPVSRAGLVTLTGVEVTPDYAQREYRGKMNAHIADLRTRARGAGLDYFLLSTDRPLDAALREYLTIRHKKN